MLRSPAIAAVAALMLLSGQSQPEPETVVQPPAGEGVICAWAIAGLVAEVGSHCAPDRNPEEQAKLRLAVARLDAYVRENSDFSESDISEFKRQQSLVGAPQAHLCQAEPMDMFEAFAADGAMAAFSGQVETLLSRPGTPTWGTCL